MTRKNCLHCGTSSHAEARYCRLCGASLRAVAIGEPFASPLDATVPLSRDLQPAIKLSGEEPDPSSSVCSSTSEPAASVTTQFAAPQHTGEPTVSPASPVDVAVDGAPTILTSVEPPSAAQTSGLAPPRLTSSVDHDDLQSALNGEGDTRAGTPHSAPVEHVAIDPNAEEAISTSYSTADQGRHKAVAAVRHSNAKSWRWWVVASTCVATVAAALTLAALTSMYSRRADAPSGEATGITASEASEPHNESLRLTAEAEKLLAGGATEAAITRLREAVRLDDQNARAQLQLGAALERTGKRSEAIVFYQAASALAPNDPQAWQPLAEAQFAENRFAEAAQSYRRFFDLTENAARGGASRANDSVRLRYAEALRLAGESDQAQSLLAQVAAPSPETSAGEEGKAGESLPSAHLPASSVEARSTAAAKPAVPTSPERATNASKSADKNSAETAVPPQERFERAVRLFSSDRQAALKEFEAVADRIPDAHYYLGLARTEGRPLQSVHRAILLEALKHFQTAQSAGGRYSQQAKRLADQLGREYDRRRKEGKG